MAKKRGSALGRRPSQGLRKPGKNKLVYPRHSLGPEARQPAYLLVVLSTLLWESWRPKQGQPPLPHPQRVPTRLWPIGEGTSQQHRSLPEHHTLLVLSHLLGNFSQALVSHFPGPCLWPLTLASQYIHRICDPSQPWDCEHHFCADDSAMGTVSWPQAHPVPHCASCWLCPFPEGIPH